MYQPLGIQKADQNLENFFQKCTNGSSLLQTTTCALKCFLQVRMADYRNHLFVLDYLEAKKSVAVDDSYLARSCFVFAFMNHYERIATVYVYFSMSSQLKRFIRPRVRA
jgi:hypothetical protein